jgi:hypothetical protein
VETVCIFRPRKVLLSRVADLPTVIPTDLPWLPILGFALASVIAIAWSLKLARRRGRWLMAVGPLAMGAIFAAVTQLPRVDRAGPRPSAPVQATPPGSAGAMHPTGDVTATPPRETPDAGPAVEPTPLGPPPRVILRGRWAADDSAVIASTLARSLSRVPAAGGAVLELDGTGRALRPTSRGVQQYAIAATWTLRRTADADVLAGNGLGEVLGIGASPEQARHGAAARTAHAIAAALRTSLPAPLSAPGASSPSF